MIDKIKSLFFEETLKRWHFDEIVTSTEISRERVNFFLKELLRQDFIIRVKPKAKMPYYLANRDSYRFRFEKKMYGLKILEESGLFEEISSIDSIKTAIVFGSFSRGDFGRTSDVDLFVYGEAKDFNKSGIELKLKREIQLFSYKNPKEIKRELDQKIIPSMIKGFTIKGGFEPFEVKINA